MRSIRFRAALALVLAACAQVNQAPPAFRWTADVKPSVYYPLALGTVWSYDAFDPATSRQVLVVNRVIARDGNRAVLSVEPDPLAYQDLGDSIVTLPSGNTVLRTPIAAGTSWSYGAGTATITAVDAVADTPAGRFASCVRVEQIAADRRIVTVFAPQVGPVLVEIYARDGAAEVLVSKAQLRSYHQAGSESP